MMSGTLARNLRHHRRLLAALCVAAAAVELLFVLLAAALDTGPGFGNLVRMMPPAVQALFGEQLALASFSAAVAFGFQHPAVIGTGLAFVVAAGTIPAAEREAGLLELLLARPIPRWRYLLGVLALALVGVVLFPVALLLGGVVGLATVSVPSEPTWTKYVTSALGLGCLLLAFAGIALLIGATAARRGLAVARIVGLVLTLYLVDVFGERLAWLASLRWVSPFHYFRPIQTAVFGETSVAHFAVLAMTGLVCTALAFAWFERKDV